MKIRMADGGWRMARWVSLRDIFNYGSRLCGRMMTVQSGNQAMVIHQTNTLTFPQVFSRITFSKQQLVFPICFVLLLFSAFGIVYVKDMNRRLMGTLQTLQNQNVRLHNRYSQLLLEKSVWINQTRVESLAKTRYRMEIPKPESIVIL